MERRRAFAMTFDEDEKQPKSKGILSLPDDVLLEILAHCDQQTLGRLASVCKRLHKLAEDHYVWIRVSRKITLVGSSAEAALKENPNYLTVRELCRLSNNWRTAQMKQKRLVFYKIKQLPWLQSTGRTLWASYTNTIRCYSKKRNGNLQEICSKRYTLHNDDICRFSWKGNYIVSGSRDRSLSCINAETGKFVWRQEDCHASDIHDVDFHEQVLVSGSRDATVKLWHLKEQDEESGEEMGNKNLLYTIPAQDRVWSVAMNPDGRSFAMGTAGINYVQPLRVWNTETGQLLGPLGSGYQTGAGVLNIQYETPQILLSCGYDTLVRMWDMRTSLSHSVRRWIEPFDSTIYCVSSDKNNAFVTGTARHGMTRLWDKRMTEPVQMYYSGTSSSPVYSLVFSPSHMYLALDRGIYLVDYTVH